MATSLIVISFQAGKAIPVSFLVQFRIELVGDAIVLDIEVECRHCVFELLAHLINVCFCLN